MRKVAVIGTGITKFGRHDGKGIKELGAEACIKAMEDANISPKEIEVACCGCVGLLDNNSLCTPGQKILNEVAITKIPVTNVECGCASGSLAFREVWIGIASGLFDIGIAIGVEKMTGKSREETLDGMSKGGDTELEIGLTFPGLFALIARRHMKQYGTTREQLAQIAVKNHKNAYNNPIAHYKIRPTIEEVLNSPMIADPLTLYECCPISDGAAAVILASEDVARKYTDTPIYVVSSVQTSGSYTSNRDITEFECTKLAVKQAYKEAKIENPLKEIDLAEVHDCFSIAELIHYEDHGFCKKGEGGRMIEEGIVEIDGDMPINPSGGLIGKGHPLGATGIAQVHEIVLQLRGEASGRQVKGAEIGMASCMGGFFRADAASLFIHIFKRF